MVAKQNKGANWPRDAALLPEVRELILTACSKGLLKRPSEEVYSTIYSWKNIKN
jgi:hypothetical protein